MKNLIKKFIPSFLLNGYHFLLSWLAAVLYRFPSRKLKVVGVTGTNGKSTVVLMTTKILEEAGFKTASISSLRPDPLKMTMPGRLKLQKFLRQALNSGCSYAVVEVTSEGIKQHRHRFIDFDVAVFTNLTPEHIESHGGFEKYREAKGKLFQACRKIHIINADDSNAEYFLQFPAEKKILYRLKDKSTLLHSLRLLGEFNVYNALAATQVGISQGIDLAVCRRAVEKIERVPGRMEIVVRKPFSVIIDYAHTPDALEKVYQTIKGRKICVLGAAGGGRDKWKRPELGRIAAQYCHRIILTNEDPYDENPQDILDQIESGFSSPPDYMKILDRREAIQKAIGWAKPGETVIITGKGSELWMCLAHGKKIPWNDREIVREEFNKLYEKV